MKTENKSKSTSLQKPMKRFQMPKKSRVVFKNKIEKDKKNRQAFPLFLPAQPSTTLHRPNDTRRALKLSDSTPMATSLRIVLLSTDAKSLSAMNCIFSDLWQNSCQLTALHSLFFGLFFFIGLGRHRKLRPTCLLCVFYLLICGSKHFCEFKRFFLQSYLESFQVYFCSHDRKKSDHRPFFGVPNASLQPFPYIPPVQSEKTHFTISSSYRILWRPVSINYKLAGDTPENGRNFAPQKGFPNFDCYKTLECGNCYRASSIILANSPNTR